MGTRHFEQLESVSRMPVSPSLVPTERGKCGDVMDVSRMDALSDWDDWAEDEPEWWLRHPLHHPRTSRDGARRRSARKVYVHTGRKRTLA